VSVPVDVGPSTFAEHTTLRVGGPVSRWIVARTEAACIEAIVECDDIGGLSLVVGGGSNIVCSDEVFDGTVVQVAHTGVATTDRGGHLRVVAAAGESWDQLVVRALEAGAASLAPLSGIPGLVGATPIQNVGAYGAEVSQFITSVRIWDRIERSVRELSDEECEFGYRTSALKAQPDRYVVLDVVYDLPLDESVVIEYQQLADALGVGVGEAVDGERVREAVLALRSSKGMVLDAADHNTWSVGSFFVNPVIDIHAAETLPAGCPTYPSDSGVKVSAAWLIENSGIDRGFSLPGSGAHISTQHTLAICNTGSATSEDVLALAREIRARVHDRFGIELEPEPRLIGCAL
jgi:UDP-N-acetylmuramate dehydrogenase